jgi:hypothetical protein
LRFFDEAALRATHPEAPEYFVFSFLPDFGETVKKVCRSVDHTMKLKRTDMLEFLVAGVSPL